MPLYFFDTFEDGDFMRDDVGIELGSMEEARDQAAALLPEMILHVMAPREHQQFAVVVRRSDGVPVYGATMIFQGRWRQMNNAGWAVCIDTLHPRYSPLAAVRGQVLAAAYQIADASRTRTSSSRRVSVEMQDLIRTTRATVAASRAMLHR